MTVLEFIEMFVDAGNQYIKLYDNEAETIIFEGYLWEIKNSEVLANATVTSIDNITNGTNGITLNID